MKEGFIESALGSHRPKGFWSWSEARRNILEGQEVSGIPMGPVVSGEVFWRIWGLFWEPMGSVLAGCWMDHGEWCSGMSQHWALCWHHPSQRDDKTSCFSPKLCSLPEGINMKDTEKEIKWCGQRAWWQLTPGMPHVCLARSSGGHGPCYPLFSSTHLSPQGIAYLKSHKTCVTSKARVMNEIKYFAKCRKTSLIPGTAVWDFSIAAITCFSRAHKSLWFLWFVH